jgi:hypothetical protein
LPEKYSHIFLENTSNAIDYTSKRSRGGEKKIPPRDRYEHGRKIRQKLDEVWRRNQELAAERKSASLPTKDGIYLEFESAPEYDLVTKSLEDRGKGIKLLSVRTEIVEDKKIRKATVFIPTGKEQLFLKKVQAYLEEETKTNKPKHKALIESLEDIKLAVLESFWLGNKEWIPGEEAKWCEIWLSDDSEEVEAEFRQLAKDELHIELGKESLKFPERRVLLGKVNRHQLQELVAASPHIAEFRRASEIVFFDEMENREQTEWAVDLLERMDIDDKTNVCVCLLDTGVNNGHILLQPILSDDDCLAYDASWDPHDYVGHGTNMAGLVAFGDLQKALESNSRVEIRHRLESAKVLPDKGENDPKLYGAIVSESISRMTINHPKRQRIVCMAITSPKYSIGDGSPSSWSAAIDEMAFGYLDEQQKLIILAAGNVDESRDWSAYPDSNKTRTIQNPGQAWNAVTVGAFTNLTEIDETKYSGKALAPAGGLSPYSTTSCMWDDKWPIKPDIVLEGGNVLRDSYGCTQCTEFSLLTLHHRPFERQFSTIWATSAATAQAAWMAAQIQAHYPQAWPETIRALLIHSATWTNEMKHQFLAGKNKSDYRELLRTCGYGVPNLEKALWCMRNSVNLVIQAELQPYDKSENGNRYITKEMHIHKLPWPQQELLDLADTPVTLKITLSYFIEPGPGEIGWKDRYRYPSCLLRFDVNGTDSKEAFLRRINAAIQDEEERSEGGGVSWTLGPRNRNKGSIHSDTWQTTAAQLAESNYIGVYPAIGWWRERGWLGKWNRKVRYALIVTIETPKQNVDLYTPIQTMIKTPIEISIT